MASITDLDKVNKGKKVDSFPLAVVVEVVVTAWDYFNEKNIGLSSSRPNRKKKEV
jgi:hypothetical protein